VSSNFDRAAEAIELLRDVPVPGGRVNAVIVSAENLINFESRVTRPLSRLRETFDVSVVAYVRRQDDFLASAWQQWFCKRDGDLWAWTLRALRTFGNWAALLEPWVEAFGREKMIVRPYPPAAHADAVRDFFECCALPMEALNAKAGTERITTNRSFNAAVLHLMEGNTGLFASPNDNNFTDAVSELLGDSLQRRPGEHVYSAAQRTAILEHYQAGNEKLRQAFFPDLPAPLFAPPSPDPQARAWRQPVSLDELREEVDVLSRLFLALYKRKPPRP